MSKVSDNKVKVERWAVKSDDKTLHPSGKKVVTKVAVRNSLGQFHGATNFRGSRLG